MGCGLMTTRQCIWGLWSLLILVYAGWNNGVLHYSVSLVHVACMWQVASLEYFYFSRLLRITRSDNNSKPWPPLHGWGWQFHIRVFSLSWVMRVVFPYLLCGFWIYDKWYILWHDGSVFHELEFPSVGGRFCFLIRKCFPLTQIFRKIFKYIIILL